MKEKILEVLRTKYSNLGLSKDILDGYAEYLSATVTEENGIEAAVAAIEPLLKQQQKEFDKIRTQKKAEEVKKESPKEKEPEKTEKQEVAPEPEKVKPEQPKEKEEEKPPKWLKKFTDRIEQLENEVKQRDKTAMLDKRRAEVNSIVSKLPQSVQSLYYRTNLDISDEEYEELKTTIANEVDETMKVFSKNSVFKPPFVGDGNAPKNSLSKEKAVELAKRLSNY